MLGGTIAFNIEKQRVTIDLDSKPVELWFGQASALVDGQSMSSWQGEPLHGHTARRRHVIAASLG